jgi:IS1 family transposase
MDPITKLVPVFVVGKRNTQTTLTFIRELKERILGRFQLSTDGFKPYVDAVGETFGNTNDYAQIIKTYAFRRARTEKNLYVLCRKEQLDD